MLKQYLASWAALVSLLGAVLVAFGGWFMAIQQAARYREIAALQEKLASKGAEIAQMQNRSLQWISGGDSYAYYVPWVTADGHLGFFLRHSGDYPAYDVTLRVRDDLTGRLRGQPMIVAPMLLAGRGLEWIAPDSLLFPNPPGRQAREHRLTLEISVRSGIVIIQRIRIWPKDGAWYTDSKDIKQSDRTSPPRPPEDFKEFQER